MNLSRTIFGILVAILLIPCVTTEAYEYKVDKKTYYLHVDPSDKISADLVKQYRLRSIDTSIGMILNAENVTILLTEVRPLVTSTKVYVRHGFSLITDAEFAKLVDKAKKRFTDMNGVSWEDIKGGLARRDWARPLLVEGEFASGKFLIHNTILTYWRD